MRWCVVLLVGCNQVWGLDSTKPGDAFGIPPDANPFLDEDLDGVLNADDNCPGVPNPGQENSVNQVGQEDLVGDACDPDDSELNTVLATYFFNDASEAALFTPSAELTFTNGYWNIARAAGFSYLDAKTIPSFTRGAITIEAGFELLDQETGTNVGAYIDGKDVHSALVEIQPEVWLYMYNAPPGACPSPGAMNSVCDREVIPQLPARVVVQVKSRTNRPRMGDVKAILAGTGVDTKHDGAGVTASNQYGVVVRSANARLHHIVVYTAPFP
jgi:hypothetical protein